MHRKKSEKCECALDGGGEGGMSWMWVLTMQTKRGGIIMIKGKNHQKSTHQHSNGQMGCSMFIIHNTIEV